MTAVPTDDGRYVVINGRRWRATDPSIGTEDGQTLRSELMSARRAVKEALRTDDLEAERLARARVQAAKVALGERGTPWWEQTTEERDARVRTAVAELAKRSAVPNPPQAARPSADASRSAPPPPAPS